MIPIIPTQAEQSEAQAKLDAAGPGWALSHVQKGNFVAVRNGQSGVIESQAAATLDGLVASVELREQQIAQTPVPAPPEHGGPALSRRSNRAAARA